MPGMMCGWATTGETLTPGNYVYGNSQDDHNHGAGDS